MSILAAWNMYGIPRRQSSRTIYLLYLQRLVACFTVCVISHMCAVYFNVCVCLSLYSGQIRGQRSSYQYWYDRDWLNTGHIYGLSFLENYSQQNSKKIAATHQLLGDIQHVVEVLNGLQLKINVLQ